MKEITSDQKIEILKSILEEKYETLRTIRTRVQEICLWSLGIIVGASAWLIQSDLYLDIGEKILFIFIGIAIFIILRFVYFKDLEKGFKSQQKALVKIETALKLYEPGVYLDGQSVYDDSWINAGTEKGEGNFFKVNYYLLLLGLVIFVLVLLTKDTFYFCFSL